MNILYSKAAIAGTAFEIDRGLVADLKSGKMIVVGKNSVYAYELFMDPAVYTGIKLSPEQENIDVDVEFINEDGSSSVVNMERCILVGLNGTEGMRNETVRLFVLSRFNPTIYLRAAGMLLRFLDEELKKSQKEHEAFIKFLKEICYRYASELYVDDLEELFFVYDKLGVDYFEKEYGLYLMRKEVRPMPKNEGKYGFTKEELEIVHAELEKDTEAHVVSIQEAMEYYANIPKEIVDELEAIGEEDNRDLREKMNTVANEMFVDGYCAAFYHDDEDFITVKRIAHENHLRFFLTKEFCATHPFLYVAEPGVIRAAEKLEDIGFDSVIKLY